MPDGMIMRREASKRLNPLQTRSLNTATKYCAKKARQRDKYQASKDDTLHDSRSCEESDEDDSEQPITVNLGNERMFAVSTFMGRRLASLRQYFSKGAQKLPTKKGISLEDECVRELCEQSNLISDALAAKNTMLRISLDEKRKVCIKQYKDEWFVDIREILEGKYGKEIPTRKGLLLTQKVFSSLKERL